MRGITKTIRVKQRDNSYKTEQAIDKAIIRYVKKMGAKGWLLAEIFEGNEFLYYKAIVELVKYSEKDKKRIEAGELSEVADFTAINFCKRYELTNYCA